MLTAYCYQKCSTCRDALKWLEERDIPVEIKAIRENPPSRAELQEAVDAAGGDIRKIFNTSGMDYREMGLKDRLPDMSIDEAFALMAMNGNLVKRPFLIGDGKVLVGFKKDLWQKVLA